MKIRKFISIIVLAIVITLGLTFGSFATDSVVDNENTNNVEDNLENNEDNTGESNEDNNGNNDSESSEGDNSENTDNSNNDNNEDVNIENNDNKNQDNTENDNDNENQNQTENDNDNENENQTGNSNSDKPNNNDKEETNKDQDDNTSIDNEPEKEETTVEENPIKTEPTDTENTVVQVKSENADLKKLILDIEGLSPEFDKDITEYYLIVDLSIEEISIEAYPDDINSIVMIDGNTDLQEGENTISITVRAEAGNTKTYTIYVTKTDDVDMVNANLKSLSVKGFNFYPSFKNNIYNYNLTINEKISQLEITVEPEIEEATYEIIGNENLVEGDNLIKIIVTAKDGAAKREYKLNVFISSKNVELQETNKTPAIVLLSVLGVAIIGTAISISKKH